jgi:guanylate kinase
VISGPSGVGKGTVVRALLAARPELFFSVSHTTREPRVGEVDGVHYRFVSREAFDEMLARGGFLEWAEVFGERYGTPLEAVRSALVEGKDTLLEVDVQGAASVRERVPQAILVFLRPPSEEELGRRLRARGTEAGPELDRRLAEARRELAEAPRFDREVVNDDVDRAVDQVLAIIDGQEGTPT